MKTSLLGGVSIVCIGTLACSAWKPEGPFQVAVSAQTPMATTTNVGFSTPTGEVIIIDQDGKRATFATKSGVVFKQIDLDHPEHFETHKTFTSQIHTSTDSLEVEAEWIGERVFWSARTNRLNTHGANNLVLASSFGTPLVPVCARCDWIPVFDAQTSKTVYYRAQGATPAIPIDVWTKTAELSFLASVK